MPDTPAATTVIAGAAIPAQRTAAPSAPIPPPPARFPLARHLQAVIEQGLHPATGAPVHPDPDVYCATCVHAVTRVLADGSTRTRCALSPSRRRGPDLVAALRACIRHHMEDNPIP